VVEERPLAQAAQGYEASHCPTVASFHFNSSPTTVTSWGMYTDLMAAVRALAQQIAATVQQGKGRAGG
jgi:hypothetical protein